MTSEQIAEIRARIERGMYFDTGVPALLDALEAAENELLDIKAIFANAEIEEAANQDMLLKAEQRAETAEARCLALERALLSTEERVITPCMVCVLKTTGSRSGCESCVESGYLSNWTFDIDRFSGKLENADNNEDADTESGVEQVTGKLDGSSE